MTEANLKAKTYIAEVMQNKASTVENYKYLGK